MTFQVTLLSNHQICKITFLVVLPLVVLVVQPVRWDKSAHMHTSGIPARIPSCVDTLVCSSYPLGHWVDKAATREQSHLP
jgi:hypothetical protein